MRNQSLDESRDNSTDDDSRDDDSRDDDSTDDSTENTSDPDDGPSSSDAPELKQPIQIIIHNHPVASENAGSPSKRKYSEVRADMKREEEEDDDDDYDFEDDFLDDDDEDDDDDDASFEIEVDLDDDEEDEDDDYRLKYLLKRLDDPQLKDAVKLEQDEDKKDRHMTNFIEKSTMNDLKYFKSLPSDERFFYAKAQSELEQDDDLTKPLKFKLLSKKIDLKTKVFIYKKLQNLSSMSPVNGEYHKLKNWVETLCDVPFNVYHDLPVRLSDGEEKVKTFLKHSRESFDKYVYGHDACKEQIMRVIAQWISNPTSKGNVIGLHGSPGVGKTTLIKNGLAKVLDLPFDFIPLGGAHDSSFLDGHGFTYEGSTWGRILQGVINSKCMNPVIYFDELDKVSDTSKGQEIINVLIHLTDPSQNTSFSDKYFSDIPFDLSRALIVFTYNDDSILNPILKDRMVRISTEGYSLTDKIKISRDYLIPEIKAQFNMKTDDYKFSDDMIKLVISKTDEEDGVRNLKRSFESILSNLNINRLLGKDDCVGDIKADVVTKFLKNVKQPTTKIPTMYV